MNNTSSNFNKMDKSIFAGFDGVTPSNKVSNQKSSYNFEEGDSLDDRSSESGYKNAEEYLKSHISSLKISIMGSSNHRIPRSLAHSKETRTSIRLIRNPWIFKIIMFKNLIGQILKMETILMILCLCFLRKFP